MGYVALALVHTTYQGFISKETKLKGKLGLDISASEIRALEAAIDQFNDMIGGGSQDEQHEVHFEVLSGLLKKAKAYKRSKKLVVTDVQIKAIYDQFTDCDAMLGSAADDSSWHSNIKAVNRMFKANNLPIIE
ncbi:hypothetical protein TUMSATVNIG1_59720 (plasmid) [Vibrio nigripulchritudo]|uniref:hypothetical protein n=1 Tax=Vibrio nigripulchritudo TaxID=28173 RepID=UPI00190BD3E3|nr:hypothetical protein [Vibrio nigripulchritudo]BCL73986.1 hypothetical protein VNTUMSATTG_59230 [Vibrio nigripulchritudo]BDU35363.1 hypothetical protein TUMSATVNIG1_59720 [Vibrio nigripulchritudo]